MDNFIDRESITDAEWYKFLRQEQGKAIHEQYKTILKLRSELEKKNDAILASKLTTKKHRHDYLPQPKGKIGAGTARDWCHVIIDKAYEARALEEKMTLVDVSSQASVDDKMFALDANEFKAWASAVAEIVTLCTSWLNCKGVGEIARMQLYHEINERNE